MCGCCSPQGADLGKERKKGGGVGEKGEGGSQREINREEEREGEERRGEDSRAAAK